MRFSTNPEDFRDKVVAVVGNSGNHDLTLGSIGWVRRVSDDTVRIRTSVAADGSGNIPNAQWTLPVEDIAIMEDRDPVWVDGTRLTITSLDPYDPYGMVNADGWRSVREGLRAFPDPDTANEDTTYRNRRSGDLYRVIADTCSHQLPVGSIVKAVGPSSETMSGLSNTATSYSVGGRRPHMGQRDLAVLRAGSTLMKGGSQHALISFVRDYDQPKPLLVHGYGWVGIDEVTFLDEAPVSAPPENMDRFTFEDVDPDATEPVDVYITFTTSASSLESGVRLGTVVVPLVPLMTDGLSVEPLPDEQARVTLPAMYSGHRLRVGESSVLLRTIETDVTIKAGPEKESVARMNAGVFSCRHSSHDHCYVVFPANDGTVRVVEMRGSGEIVQHDGLAAMPGGCNLQLQAHQDYLFRGRGSTVVTVPIADPMSTFGSAVTVVRRRVAAA